MRHSWLPPSIDCYGLSLAAKLSPELAAAGMSHRLFDREGRQRREPTHRFAPPLSGEIVAANRLVGADGRGPARPERWSDSTARRRVAPPKRAQDRQRQVGITGLDGLIQPVRQLALVRQRAMPFAVVVGEAADLPLRQFQIDQRERCIVQPATRSGVRRGWPWR